MGAQQGAQESTSWSSNGRQGGSDVLFHAYNGLDVCVLEVSLIALGLVLLSAGLGLSFASFAWTRRRSVIDLGGSTSLIEASSTTGRPYRGIVIPLHYPITEFTFTFNEQSGREVEVKVMDLVPEYGGQHIVLTYSQEVGSAGILRVGLHPGTYDVHISSTDNEDRNVDYFIKGRETTYPFRRYLEVALTTATIGAVALIQGLVLAAE